MSTWVNYWRIIRPDFISKVPNQITPDVGGMGSASYDSMSWYNQVMRGETNRLQRYKQYEGMDSDVDVSRALDVVAEQMSTDDRTTRLSFEIDYQVEDNQEVSETVTTTIRAAIRQWINLQDLPNRIFKIARYTLKYGDCFFRRDSPLKKWEWIDPNIVIGVEVNSKKERVAYHLKKELRDKITGNSRVDTEVIPAHEIIHFSLSDDIGPSAPFGESILQPVVSTFKRLSMLENAAVIYQIVRAPERRAFYIDVGNVPPQRVKAYMEQIKNDLRQKRQPGKNASGEDIIDGTLNPTALQEDYFFPVNAAGRSSRVETIPGGEQDINNFGLGYFRTKLLSGLKIPASYMKGAAEQGAQVNDGKVGIAYMEEQQFATYVERLQSKFETVYDNEFKLYMNNVGIKVDDDLFLLKLPVPQNFKLYRQAALDAELISTFNTAEQIKYLSRRFILKRFLGLSEDEVQMNESMLKQERNIRDDLSVADLQQIYDPAFYENRDAIKLLDSELENVGEPDGGGAGGDMGMGDMGSPGTEFGGGGGDMGGSPTEEPGGAGELGAPEGGETTPPAEEPASVAL